LSLLSTFLDLSWLATSPTMEIFRWTINSLIWHCCSNAEPLQSKAILFWGNYTSIVQRYSNKERNEWLAYRFPIKKRKAVLCL
jgi:hypothetical protein